MKKNIKSPCKNCDKRQVGCHSSCEDYSAFKKYLAEVKKANEHRRLQNDIFGMARERRRKYDKIVK